MSERGLTERQHRFVQAFMGPAQGNGTLAAQMAGVDRRSAATMAWKWLRKVEVQRALVSRREHKEAVGAVTAAERESFMAAVMRDETQDMKNRLKAVDMLNRCAGAYSLTHVLKGRVGLAELISRSRRLRPEDADQPTARGLEQRS